MVSKKKALKDSSLCIILDREFLKAGRMPRFGRIAASAGVSLIQIRDKHSTFSQALEAAREIKRITRRRRIPLVINDRVDVAVAVDADGLHIGQGDISLPLARRLMGRGKLIGLSVGSFGQGLRAKRLKADYVGAGPVFSTPIKRSVRPRGIGFLKRLRRLNIPFFAIGGIDPANVSALAGRGFRRIAVIRAFSNARDPRKAISCLKKAVK
jgi:thiamine-phosphate pyrophosphorylase